MVRFIFAVFLSLAISGVSLAGDAIQITDRGDDSMEAFYDYPPRIPNDDRSDRNGIGVCFRVFNNGTVQQRRQRCNQSRQCNDNDRGTLDLCVI